MTDGERRALWILRIAGTATIGLFIVMGALMPKGPVERMQPGFGNVVIAFEMAAGPEDVFAILGHPGAPARDEAVQRMDQVNVLDYLFMIAYPSIFAGIALLLQAHGNLAGGATRLVIGLAVVMFVGDALENRELLTLSQLVDPQAMTAPLVRLRFFTLTKFAAFFIASAVIAPGVWRETGWWRWAAIAFGLGAILGFGMVFHLPAIEWGTFPVAIGWMMAWVHSLRARSAS